MTNPLEESHPDTAPPAETGASIPPAPPVDEAPPQTPELKKAALRSAAWTMVGFGTMQILRMASNIILAWLLFPEIFGLMSLVNVFIQGLHMFTDIGIGPSIVRSEHGEDPNFLNTAWTMQVVRGVGLWIASGIIAIPVAYIYQDENTKPQLLMQLIPAVGLATAISGFNSTAMLTHSRRLAQSRLVMMEIGSYVVSQAIVIYWVSIEQTVWALVVGNLISSVIVLACSHLLLHGIRHRWHWERPYVHEILHFGKWIFLGTLLTFVGGQADTLVVGKLSLTLLGIYGIGRTLAAMPATLVDTLNWQLVFPLYSRAFAAGVDQRSAFRRIHLSITGFAAYAVTGLIATGPAFIRCAYDNRYQDAGWMVQLVALGAWFKMLETTGDSYLLALGKSGVSAISNGAKVVAIPILVPLGYWLGGQYERGLEGMIIGFVATDIVRYATTTWLIRREGMPIIRYDAIMTALIGIGSALVLQIDRLQWAQDNRWLRFGAEVAAVTLFWSVLLFFGWFRGIIRLSWRMKP